jgi:hypothetical protein
VPIRKSLYKEEIKMKKYLFLVCVIGFIWGCSSAGGINIISPSTPENEVKEKVSKAPVTKLHAVSESELKEDSQASPPQASAEISPKAGTPAVSDRSDAGSAPSIRSGQALEALIILLENKGSIKREELLQEIRKLEEKERTK